MDKKVVLDTSVLIKWFIQEDDSNEALKLLEEIKSGTVRLVLPQVVLLELINALFWGNKYAEEGILKAISDLNDLHPEIVIFDFQLAKEVVRNVVGFKIATYDALFLALAQQKQIPLITADRKHHLREYSPLVRYLS